MLSLFATLLMIALAGPASDAPSIFVMWNQPASPLIATYAIYKRLPTPESAWVLVHLHANSPGHRVWEDFAVLPGTEWCYKIVAISEEGVASADSPIACGVVPQP